MFKFTIRDLLWLTVVVAMGMAWVLDHLWMARSASEWEKQAEYARGTLHLFGWTVTDDFKSYPIEKNAIWPVPRGGVAPAGQSLYTQEELKEVLRAEREAIQKDLMEQRTDPQ